MHEEGEVVDGSLQHHRDNSQGDMPQETMRQTAVFSSSKKKLEIVVFGRASSRGAINSHPRHLWHQEKDFCSVAGSHDDSRLCFNTSVAKLSVPVVRLRVGTTRQVLSTRRQPAAGQ